MDVASNNIPLKGRKFDELRDYIEAKQTEIDSMDLMSEKRIICRYSTKI